MTNVPQRYVPKKLSKRDKKKQKKELKKSRKAYKKGKYYTRKKVKSFKSKVSPHILKARKMYKIEKIRPTRKLAKATKCKLKGLKKMFQKGQGAYFEFPNPWATGCQKGWHHSKQKYLNYHRVPCDAIPHVKENFHIAVLTASLQWASPSTLRYHPQPTKFLAMC